jgi:hypothetical protein
MSKLNLSEFTISHNAQAVTVSEFRDRIQHLEQVINVDLHACVDDKEKAICADIAKRVGHKLINTTCTRAKLDDWLRRERIIDSSSAFIESL